MYGGNENIYTLNLLSDYQYGLRFKYVLFSQQQSMIQFAI